MMAERNCVCVVDDDESVRESLPDLLRSYGFVTRAFASAEEFLSSDSQAETSCLVLDVAMPGMTGPELQDELRHRNAGIPIVFITAQPDDDRLCARLLQRGAVACLLKPFGEEAIVAAINRAIHGR